MSNQTYIFRRNLGSRKKSCGANSMECGGVIDNNNPSIGQKNHSLVQHRTHVTVNSVTMFDQNT